MGCSPPGSSVHGIFQARVLEWVANSFSRGSSPPRDQTRISHIAGGRLTIWATMKPSQVMTCQFQDWVIKSVTSILLTHTLSFRVLALRKQTACCKLPYDGVYMAQTWGWPLDNSQKGTEDFSPTALENQILPTIMWILILPLLYLWMRQQTEMTPWQQPCGRPGKQVGDHWGPFRSSLSCN